jgi:hypothetical protein
MISSSNFDSSTPATSSKVTWCWFSVSSRATCEAHRLAAAGLHLRMKKTQSPMISSIGNHIIRTRRQTLPSGRAAP